MKAAEVKQTIVWDWMRPLVQSVQFDTPINEAVAEMDKRRIHHLVVLKDDEFVGILDARDCAGIWDKDLPVQAVMRKNVPVIDENTEVQEAVNLLVTHRMTALPLKAASGICGVITSTDLLRLLAKHINEERTIPHLIEKGVNILTKPVVQGLAKFFADVGL